MSDHLVEALTDLFEETRKAHHQDFRDVGGEDPGWASWYADYAHERIEAMLDVALGQGKLARLLEEAEEGRAEESPDADRSRWYAEFFARRFG